MSACAAAAVGAGNVRDRQERLLLAPFTGEPVGTTLFPDRCALPAPATTGDAACRD